MRVVIDTNVVVSALKFGGKPLLLLQECLTSPSIEMVMSHDIVQEVLEVMARKFEYGPRELLLTENLLTKNSSMVMPAKSIKIVRDSKDDKFVEAAVEGDAEYIISGDFDLLDIGSYKNIKIITVARFWEIITK